MAPKKQNIKRASCHFGRRAKSPIIFVNTLIIRTTTREAALRDLSILKQSSVQGDRGEKKLTLVILQKLRHLSIACIGEMRLFYRFHPHTLLS